LLAAESQSANKMVPNPSATPTAAAVAATAAKKCVSDLRTFDAKMQKEGYWLRGAGVGYGYPMSNYEGERGATMHLDSNSADSGRNAITDKKEGTEGKSRTPRVETSAGYWRARPGYEIRTLVIAANILARRGQQNECEAVLNTTRSIYKTYETDLRNDKVPKAGMSARQDQQIASAQWVTTNDASVRSDQLIGTSVVSQQNKVLGSVDDIIMSPKTGRIAYLVIGRGGVFGIDEKYVPVPWKDFKVTSDSNLLVLDTNKHTMNNAPQVEQSHFSKDGGFAKQSKKIDDYWKVPQS
jgi:sporulation protein YlmC with PRC-barrel domain